jgi:hypothetical protein
MVTTDRRPQGAPSWLPRFTHGFIAVHDPAPFMPALPRLQSGTLRRTPLPGCPDRPERPGARPGLDYLVAMAPSILLSIGFFLLSHRAGANWECSPGKLEV